jgi:hypothetical protein
MALAEPCECRITQLGGKLPKFPGFGGAEPREKDAQKAHTVWLNHSIVWINQSLFFRENRRIR